MEERIKTNQLNIQQLRDIVKNMRKSVDGNYLLYADDGAIKEIRDMRKNYPTITLKTGQAGKGIIYEDYKGGSAKTIKCSAT